jgi:opacity protein-like surface antigen
MKKMLSALSAGLLVMLFTGSNAHAVSPYVSGSVGLGYMTDSEVDVSGVHAADLEYDSGFLVTGAVGVKADMYRLEAEVGYQTNDLNKFTEPGSTGEAVTDGSLNTFSVLANGYLDFGMTDSKIVPFVTAGVGLASVGLESTSDFGGDIDVDDTVLAYQLGAGMGIELSPSVMMDVRYRYFATADPEFDVDGEKLKLDVDSHNVMLGMRVGF